MKSVILAAGTASRLRPLTDNTPKCLLDVGHKNILALTIDNILANGISDIIIVTGYLENKIKDFVAAYYPKLRVQYIYNSIYATTNNIYSLWLVKELVTGVDFLLMDSDIIFDKSIITKLIHSPHKDCLALKVQDVGEEEIKVKMDRHGRILEISKEVNPKEAIGESIGIEKFGKELAAKLFAVMERKINVEKMVNQFYEAAFQELISNGESIFAVDVSEFMCIEIDTASDLEVARKMVLKLT